MASPRLPTKRSTPIASPFILSITAKKKYAGRDCTAFSCCDIVLQVYCVVCKDVEGWSLPLGKGLAGFVAKNGVALNIEDAYADPRLPPYRVHASAFVKLSSWL
jgi:hypothetical protein